MTETPPLPTDLFVRSPTKEDVQAIVDIVLADELAETGFTDTVAEDLLEVWQNHEMDLAHDACVLTIADGTIIAYPGVMITDEGFMLDPHTREHPDYQQRNLKPYLLQFIEGHAQAYLTQHPEHPRQISTQCFSAPWIHFLTSQGYTQNNHYIRMEVQLAEVPPKPRPMEGISIRRYQPEQDEAAVHAVVQDAFQDIGKHPYQPFAEWLESKTQRNGFDPSMLYVAVAGEKIGGTTICRTYSEDNSCFISQVAVARPWRKHGIALNLLYTVYIP